jgi:hypothetical protein
LKSASQVLYFEIDRPSDNLSDGETPALRAQAGGTQITSLIITMSFLDFEIKPEVLSVTEFVSLYVPEPKLAAGGSSGHALNALVLAKPGDGKTTLATQLLSSMKATGKLSQVCVLSGLYTRGMIEPPPQLQVFESIASGAIAALTPKATAKLAAYGMKRIGIHAGKGVPYSGMAVVIDDPHGAWDPRSSASSGS